jgi:cell wall-associated NlpC family hydrolase
MRSSLGRLAAAMALGVGLLPFSAMLLGATTVIADLSSTGPGGAVGSFPGQAVPLAWRLVETDAASTCPDLDWSVLGALGFITSGSGRWPRRTPPWWPWPGGLFGIEPTGASSVQADARRAAAQLCEARRETGSLVGALVDLTGKAPAALSIEIVATSLAQEPTLAAGRAQAIYFAAQAIGTPYQWGGNGPSSYDCSGLMVAAWRSAGVDLPRTAQEQYDATGRFLGPPEPGDLVFFGTSTDAVEHVGIEIGSGLMIDAPHTGAQVRVDPDGFTGSVGAGRVA